MTKEELEQERASLEFRLQKAQEDKKLSGKERAIDCKTEEKSKVEYCVVMGMSASSALVWGIFDSNREEKINEGWKRLRIPEFFEKGVIAPGVDVWGGSEPSVVMVYVVVQQLYREAKS